MHIWTFAKEIFDFNGPQHPKKGGWDPPKSNYIKLPGGVETFQLDGKTTGTKQQQHHTHLQQGGRDMIPLLADPE